MKNKTQKNITVILTICVSLLIIIGLGYAFQDYLKISPKPEKVTKNFYQSWINQKESPLASEFYKNHISLTKRLENNIQATIDSFDKGGAADPILCAQDKPQNMSFELISKTNERAIVKIYEDFGGNSQTIKVVLVKNIDGWLIDEIICHDKSNDVVNIDNSNLVDNYIRENIEDLSPEKPILGGSFYVTKIKFLNENSAFVNYEDGHIALSALVNFYLNDDKIEITSFEIKEDGINFSETGNIVSGNSGWEIVYEKPGKPALREALIFTDNSKCMDEGVNFVCDSDYWKNGDRVKINGKLKYDGVEITNLTMITENSQIIPDTDNDIDNCQERGGVIMFPDCVGCDPYCSFSEEGVIKKTINDSDSFCVDNCGNGICEEFVCLGEGCPCAETINNCPADCN